MLNKILAVLVVVLVVLVGWLIIRREIGIRQEQKNFADLTDTSNRAIGDQVRLWREAAEANRQQAEWLGRYYGRRDLWYRHWEHNWERPPQQTRAQLEATRKARDAALDEHTRALKAQQAAQVAATAAERKERTRQAAIRYYRPRAETNGFAQFRLGDLLLETTNRAEGLQWLRRAAINGRTEAAARLKELEP